MLTTCTVILKDPPLSVGDTFQGVHETISNTIPMMCVYTHIYVIKINLQMRHSKGLTTDNKPENYNNTLLLSHLSKLLTWFFCTVYHIQIETTMFGLPLSF